MLVKDDTGDGRPADEPTGEGLALDLGSAARRRNTLDRDRRASMMMGSAQAADGRATMVTYEMKPGGPIVFTANVDGFGAVTITSRKPGIFNGRLTDRIILRAALNAVEAFADDHKAELATCYEAIAAAQNAA
jgi:hypothetical protein